MPFMEDFEFVRRFAKTGRVEIVNQSATTSGRRWKKLGLVKTTIINQVIIFSYLLGVSPHSLIQLYYG